MTDLRAAAQQALEAMESADFDPHSSDAIYKAIIALKAALEADDGMYGAKALTVAYENGWNAAKAEPVQEPVAWRWGYRSITTGEMDWRGYVEIAAHPNLRSPAIIMQPLYAAPPQRKPLAEEEIARLATNDMVKFAREIERMHNITGDNT